MVWGSKAVFIMCKKSVLVAGGCVHDWVSFTHIQIWQVDRGWEKHFLVKTILSGAGASRGERCVGRGCFCQ